jgi:DNA-binding response OmpR family regulator
MEKVLLIDPDLVLTEELTFLLQHLGFQVVSTIKGRQAIVEIKRRRPDVIIVAEDSRRLDTGRLCACIRKVCQSPIIILGEAQKEAAGIKMLEIGADAYLTFPLDLRELLARLRSLLHRTQAKAREHKGGY